MSLSANHVFFNGLDLVSFLNISRTCFGLSPLPPFSHPHVSYPFCGMDEVGNTIIKSANNITMQAGGDLIVNSIDVSSILSRLLVICNTSSLPLATNSSFPLPFFGSDSSGNIVLRSSQSIVFAGGLVWVNGVNIFEQLLYFQVWSTAPTKTTTTTIMTATVATTIITTSTTNTVATATTKTALTTASSSSQVPLGYTPTIIWSTLSRGCNGTNFPVGSTFIKLYCELHGCPWSSFMISYAVWVSNETSTFNESYSAFTNVQLTSQWTITVPIIQGKCSVCLEADNFGSIIVDNSTVIATMTNTYQWNNPACTDISLESGTHSIIAILLNAPNSNNDSWLSNPGAIAATISCNVAYYTTSSTSTTTTTTAPATH